MMLGYPYTNMYIFFPKKSTDFVQIPRAQKQQQKTAKILAKNQKKKSSACAFNLIQKLWLFKINYLTRTDTQKKSVQFAKKFFRKTLNLLKRRINTIAVSI